MTFSEKTIVVSLSTGILVLAYFVIRSSVIYAGGIPEPVLVYRLWGITIGLTVLFNSAGNILAQILTAIMEAIRSGGDDVEIEDVTDERDELIKLRGTFSPERCRWPSRRDGRSTCAESHPCGRGHKTLALRASSICV